MFRKRNENCVYVELQQAVDVLMVLPVEEKRRRGSTGLRVRIRAKGDKHTVHLSSRCSVMLQESYRPPLV